MTMLAVIPVRDGVVPAGGAEVAAECGGRVLIASSTAMVELDDVAALSGLGHDVRIVDLGPFAPARWASQLAGIVADEAMVVLPGSPDGRDLAPRLAHATSRSLRAGAVEVTADTITVSRHGGLRLHTYRVDGPTVATLQPGVRGIESLPVSGVVTEISAVSPAAGGTVHTALDAEILEVLPPDAATIDLGEAPRIAAGGAGLDGPDRFTQLDRIAAAIGASVGATRVITDRGWIQHDRQIGTTGVIVDPRLYLAFGISGAVQHTSGLGDPRHVISVNTDPYCPMMQLADLAVVSDANAVLDHLERILAGGGDA